MNHIGEEKTRELAARMDEIRRRIRSVRGNLSAEVIREGRDKGWSE